jgi:hypothetical protein
MLFGPTVGQTEGATAREVRIAVLPNSPHSNPLHYYIWKELQQLVYEKQNLLVRGVVNTKSVDDKDEFKP